MIESINPKGAPKVIGPYSLGIIDSSNNVYISGQLGIDPLSNELVEGVENQCRQALENMKMILEEVGYTMENVVRTTIYLKDINDFAKVNEIYATYFKKPYPARSAFEVANLPKGGLVEIEAIAYKYNGLLLKMDNQ